MAELFYFIDTRKNTKQTEPFAISNPDVAKTWNKDYNMQEGPFKSVEKPLSEKGSGVVSDSAEFDPAFQVNRHDLKQAGVNQTEYQEEATKHNSSVLDVDGDRYANAEKSELKQELDARGIKYKINGPESTNDFYKKLLIADDNE